MRSNKFLLIHIQQTTASVTAGPYTDLRYFRVFRVLLPKYHDDMEYIARNLKEEYEK
jgi:hypothetical protein